MVWCGPSRTAARPTVHMVTALHAQTQMGHSCPTASKWRGGGVEEVVEAVSGVLFYCYRFITAEAG